MLFLVQSDLASRYLLPLIGSGCPNAPALADLDGDGVPEILTNGIAGPLRVFSANGMGYHSGQFGGTFPNNQNSYGALSDAKDAPTIGIIANPAVGDIDDDGVLDVVLPTAGLNNALGMANGGVRRDAEHHVSVWDSKTGDFKPGFPRVIEDFQFFNDPGVADMDGDGHSEVIEGSGGYWVHAWNANGVEAKGFPKLTGGWITTAPAIGDMDGDGLLELAITTREGWLYAWHTQGKAKGRIDWPSFHHDNWNTGNFATPLDQGVAATPGGTMMKATGGGCSCDVGARGAHSRRWPGIAILGLFGAFLLRPLARRRRGSR